HHCQQAALEALLPAGGWLREWISGDLDPELLVVGVGVELAVVVLDLEILLRDDGRGGRGLTGDGEHRKASDRGGSSSIHCSLLHHSYPLKVGRLSCRPS